MKLKSISNTTSDSTSHFEIKDRTIKEAKDMKESGYVEHDRFKISNELRTDGYFCGSCKHWSKQPFSMPIEPSDHNGFCQKWKYRSEDYGCCNSWVAKSGLFNYNPS